MQKLPTFSSGPALPMVLLLISDPDEIVQADEQRIDAVDDGVIDLEVGQMLDAALLHVGQRADVVQASGGSRRGRPGERASESFAASSSWPSMEKAGIMPCWKKKMAEGS